MPRLTVPGDSPIELQYEDTGGPGRPVVLIHGWPVSGESWAAQVPALADAGHRVVTYDRRGFGRSDKPADGYEYDTLAADLRAVVTELDLHDAVLVGFSMGGGEVARYVGRFGDDDLCAVVLASAVPPCLYQTTDNPGGPMTDEAVTELQDGLRAGREEFFDGFMRNFFTAGEDLKVTEGQLADTLALCRQADEGAAVACIAAFSKTDFRNDISRIGVPTLVIHGDSDAIVPFEVSGELTHKKIEGSTLHVVKDGPHGISTSHADEFTQALLDFLGSL